MTILDVARFRAAPLCRDPFEFVVVEDLLRREHVPALLHDFPTIADHGSFPIESLACGPSVLGLAEELTGSELREAVEEKFAVDLAGRPTMITLRGRSDGKDGRIHTDSASKLITLLIYLNPQWDVDAGRLRMLRGPDDLADYAAEVAPVAGMAVAFRRSERSFHGHRAHLGERRVLQLNWVTDPGVVQREIGRHRWSARIKSWIPFA